MLRMKNWWLRVTLAMVLGFALTCGPLIAAGSFYDTIQGAGDDAQSALSDDKPAPVTAVPPTNVQAQEQAQEQNAAVATGKVQYAISADQFQALIQRIIQAILGAFGCGRGVVIIRIPCGTPTTKPVPTTPTTPTTPPTNYPTPTGPVTPPTNTGTGTSAGSATGIEGIRAEIRDKFGINCANGDSARGWSEKQLAAARDVLKKLPACFYGNTKTIQRDGVFRSPSVLGYVAMGIPTVHMLDSSCYEGTFQGTLVHEMTHCWQANNPSLTRQWQAQWWRSGRPNPPSVSGYGNTQPAEDMAESVRSYFQAGSRMKQSHPDRYEWIKNNVMGGVEY